MSLNNGTTRIAGELARHGHLEKLTAVLLEIRDNRTNLRRLELMEVLTQPDRVYVCLEVDEAEDSSLIGKLKAQLQ